jgi:hypothetical protein
MGWGSTLRTFCVEKFLDRCCPSVESSEAINRGKELEALSAYGCGLSLIFVEPDVVEY